MKTAIIGTGIAGLGAAYLMHPHGDITVYEANAYPGGHSRTIDVTQDGRMIPVDTGFIVFNHVNYPHLTAMFRHLGVETAPSDMSFGASIARNGKPGWLEYGSKGMFAQKANLARPKYWQMLRDILRFNRDALTEVERCAPEASLRDLLDMMRMGDWFRRYYLLAMGAAIWSSPADAMLDFPARSFLSFFANHGLLTVNNQPQWHTVRGGSRAYVERLTAPFRDRIRLSSGARRVRRVDGQVEVEDATGDIARYDRAIIACHADEALAMLDQPTEAERRVLGAFRYQRNHVVVHGDLDFMPQRRGCWSSWNYLGNAEGSHNVSLSYWMNNLQPLDCVRPVIATLNPAREPAADTIHDRHDFTHPVFDLAAIRAQGQLADIQGGGNIWYCGAYQRHGFHEDGLLSAVNVAGLLGITPPWT